MEIHRLKPMKNGYDTELFNKLYKETELLRKSLSLQIDPRRYGVTRDIIESWFTDKFIFVFNKYYGLVDNKILKAHLITALKTFKYRVLRNAYNKSNFNSDIIKLEDREYFIDIIPSEETEEEENSLYDMAIKYLKKKLSNDAFFILQLELNPPEYILSKLKSTSTKIPNNLIAEYLDLSSEWIPVISDLRKEISKTTKEAREFFSKEYPQKMIY